MRKNDVAYRIYNKENIKEIEEKIILLNNPKIMTSKFLNTRLCLTIITSLLALFISDVAYFTVPLVFVITYYGYTYMMLDSGIQKRIEKLDNEALIFFEVFTLSLESGKNLEKALETTITNVDNELANEFSKVLMEIKFGKTLEESLMDLRKRIPSITINNIILNIVQTSIFGNKIIDNMNNQIDFLREKKMLTAKKKINKLPNEISIISVLFVVPLILLLVLGPFLINFLTN